MAKIRVKNVRAAEAAAKVEDATKRGTKAGKHKLRGKPSSKPKASKLTKFKPLELTPEERREREAQIAAAREAGARKYGHAKLNATLGDVMALQKFGCYMTKTRLTEEEREKVYEQ